ncbi:MAG TPA: O-antigen ligase family protein, partial [Anaerolineales bacterium]|nr:O-antigen ligase family protein [Anaerolineales bacterium]
FHVCLVCLLIFSLRDWNHAWKPAMFGLCAALTFQIVAGFGSFALQSTAFLEPLEMKWPGLLDPSIRGASVVQLQNGLRILRAYGTLPHPNILGGFALICLLGPLSLFMSDQKIHVPALILYTLGLSLIVFTFSRSAWLGVAAFLFILLLKPKHLEWRRVILLIAVSVITIVITLYPLQELVFTRFSNAPVQTEHLSTFGRAWLTEQSLDMIRANPLFGVGIGSFILKLAEGAVEGAIIEPVHNVFLLFGAELGILGQLIIAALTISIASKIIKAQKPKAILAGATLTGLGVISMFDHYFWSIPPGRLMLGFVLGLWAGQLANDDE